MKVTFCEPDPNSKGLGIPYPSALIPSTCIGYFDVKRYPEKVSEFPEIREWPELKDFIYFINQQDSIFRTLRCEVTSGKAVHEKHKITSCVTIAFEILEWNSIENFRHLFEAFKLFASTQSQVFKNVVEFEPVPTSYQDHNVTLWSLDSWNHGYGRTWDNAKKNWLAGLRILTAFVNEQNRQYRRELASDRKKIGDI